MTPAQAQVSFGDTLITKDQLKLTVFVTIPQGVFGYWANEKTGPYDRQSVLFFPWAGVQTPEMPQAVPGRVYVNAGKDRKRYIGREDGRVQALFGTHEIYPFSNLNPVEER